VGWELAGSVQTKARQACQRKWRRESGGGGLKAQDTAALRQVLLIVYDLCSTVDLASCSGHFLREQMRLFHDFLRQNPTSNFVGMELKLKGLPNNVIHISGFSGEDGGNAKLNAASQVNTAFSYGRLVWLF
jgi:hypothetical protein